MLSYGKFIERSLIEKSLLPEGCNASLTVRSKKKPLCISKRKAREALDELKSANMVTLL